MEAHSTTTSAVHPVVIIYFWFAEFLGAIIASIDSDFVRSWTAWAFVGMGLFINYVVNRKKFNAGIKEWWNEIFKRK